MERELLEPPFCRGWSAPKDGNTPEQNEDAWRAAWLPGEDGGGTLLVAVADGASEADYSRRWARTLVEAAQPEWPALEDQDLSDRLNGVRRSFSPLPTGEVSPWYIRNKYLMQGSQASLLVLTLHASPGEETLEG